MMKTLWFLLPLLVSAGALPGVSGPEMKAAGGLNNLKDGLQWAFVDVEVVSGEVFTGQVIGVYNEADFMWNPTDKSRIAVWTCIDASASLGDFSVTPGESPAIFTLTTEDIVTITITGQPHGFQEYQQFMRASGNVFSVTPVREETWISRAWDSYHTWEDGRGNYAWDIGALNTNMMSYSNYGTRNTDFAVWNKVVQLPMTGKVVTAVEKEVDNVPDMTAAVDLEDNAEGGNTVEEKPQNLIEVQVGGDSSCFQLRLIHLKQWSIPNSITVGSTYMAGTRVGNVGNSGTTLVPHLHAVWGFYDSDDRYWALPIEWQRVTDRKLLAYPTGYQYGQYHYHDYYYPAYGNVIANY